ncbi:hypothetical protein C4G56_RS22430 [Vibrio parahaemolyticus]|nr:hypothetical protein [Vibrio parahaemolyticus]EJG0655195.1 hypothetical protein [Vibrio parahaemolyticus]EJG0772121.1 hypothetical protein [Vibrio parahaemolyticus]EJG0805059.1 hypothetical protein [Vibrio parahaemolyticus]EJG0956901.1 hypothetical protein [Vibrio parahaemolyticus]
MSRNAKYEANQKEKGLKKVTIWIPENRESEFKLLAQACCDFRHLSFNTLRDTVTGQYVSLERL